MIRRIAKLQIAPNSGTGGNTPNCCQEGIYSSANEPRRSGAEKPRGKGSNDSRDAGEPGAVVEVTASTKTGSASPPVCLMFVSIAWEMGCEVVKVPEPTASWPERHHGWMSSGYTFGMTRVAIRRGTVRACGRTPKENHSELSASSPKVPGAVFGSPSRWATNPSNFWRSWSGPSRSCDR